MNQFKQSGTRLAVAALALLALTLSGCMDANSRTLDLPDNNNLFGTAMPQQVSPPPTASITVAPSPSDAASSAQQGSQQGGPSDPSGSGASGTAQNANPFDWKSQTSQVEQRIEQLSEVSDCRIVVQGDTALVGIQFANQYQGELTQRIRDMVAGEVMAADPSIRTVGVTAEEADRDVISQLADQLKNSQAAQDLESEMDKIMRNVTTLR